MIQVWLAWAYIAFLFYTAGDLSEKLLYRSFGISQDAPRLPAFIKISLGLSFFILVLTFLHFVIPINQLVHIGIASLLVLYFVFARIKLERNSIFEPLKIINALKSNVPFWLSFFTILIILSYAATDYPFYNRDNGRYHFQSLLWSKEYPIVPGLGNLHARLAYNSSWYLVTAFFDQFLLNRKSFHVVNSFLIFFLFVMCLKFIFMNQEKQGRSVLRALGIVMFLFLALNFQFLHTWLLIGVSPEAPVHFFILFFLLLLLFFYERNWLETVPRIVAAILTVVIFSAVAVRMNSVFLSISMLPLLAFLIMRRGIALRDLLKLSLIVALFVFPVVARNVILSGYLFFPSRSFDIFNFDWELPYPLVDITLEWIANYTLFSYAKEVIPFSGTLDDRRIALIWEMATTELANIGTLTFIAIGTAILLLYSLYGIIRKRKFEWLLVIFYVAFMMQFLLIYLASPSIRYSFGYAGILIILPFALVLATFLAELNPRNFFAWAMAVPVLAIIFFQIYKPSLPISIRKVGLLYPLKAAGELIQCTTFFPELVRGKQKVIVLNKNLRINVSDYDDSYLKLGRLNPPQPYFDPACGKVDFISMAPTTRDENCEAENAEVATMNWMDPLPCVGGIYYGLSLRAQDIREGFKIVQTQKSHE